MALRSRSVGLIAVLFVSALALLSNRTFVSPARTGAQPAVQQGAAVAVVNGVILASAPMPAHAGGMFDFGLTLPFVAVTFLTMMAVLNAVWYSPVSTEMDERNSKLLQTLSDATDMLAKADEIQVDYTERIRAAREKASAAVTEYKQMTERAIARDVAAAQAEQEQKLNAMKAKLDADVAAKIAAAEPEIEQKKATFVKATLAGIGM